MSAQGRSDLLALNLLTTKMRVYRSNLQRIDD
jgi:hypothetical protein